MLRFNRNNIYYMGIGILIAVFYAKFGGTLIKKLIKTYAQPKRYEVKYEPKKINPKNNQDFDIFIASSLDRVFQDGKTLLKPDFKEEAHVSLARNEYESFQVVISAGNEVLKSVKLEISDFVNADNLAKIRGQNMTWRAVGYVKTKKPNYPVKFIGMWPDPLLLKHEIDVQPRSFQPVWVEVYAPKEAQSGVYKGSIKVLSEGVILREIPASIKVYDFTISTEGHLKTAFDLYPTMVEIRHPKRENERDADYWNRLDLTIKAYTIDMLKHRINPILNIEPLSEGGLNAVDNYRRFGLNNFSIGKKGGSFDNNWPKTDEEIEKLFMLYRAYGESLKFNKMLGMHYIYIWDEGEIGNPQVKKVSSMIHRAHPELKNMVCYMGFWEPSKDPGWGDDIDIWCFQINHFNLESIQELKKLKKEIWMYVSDPGDSGSPNLAIDVDSIEYRILPWLCWKYDFKGFLYWCVNYWPYFDPFKNAMNTKWEQNGNGLLYYPGEDGPIDSLRLEVFRDGMEDYEYLYLLARKINELENKNAALDSQALITRAKTLLKIDNSIAESVFSYSKVSQGLLGRREEIAKMIESLSKL